MLKTFQQLAIGDVALTPHSYPLQWVIITAPPEPIDDSKPLGLWRVETQTGVRWLESALTEVLVNA